MAEIFNPPNPVVLKVKMLVRFEAARLLVGLVVGAMPTSPALAFPPTTRAATANIRANFVFIGRNSWV